MNWLKKCQTKNIKAALPLKIFWRNTPLLQAMNIKGISQIDIANEKDILKFMRSRTKGF